MLKLYLASSVKNKIHVTYFGDILDQNFEITYKWWEHLYLDQELNVKNDESLSFAEIAKREKNALLKSDYVIYLPPGARGSHIELGMAFASNIPVLRLNDLDHDQYEIPFYEFILQDFDTIANLVNFLKE